MLAAILLGLVVAPAAAPGLQLEWQAPAGCPDAAAVRGRVAGMLAAGAIAGSDLVATGRVSAVREGWRLELVLAGAAGRERRTLADRDCAALADAAALMIAVTIDPLAAAGDPLAAGARDPLAAIEPVGVVPQERTAVVPEVPEPVLAPEVGPEPGPEPSVPGDRSPVPGDRVEPGEAVVEPGPVPVPKDRPGARRLRVGLRAAGGAQFTGILPGPNALLELGLWLEGRGWRVELDGGFAPPVRGTASAQPAIGGRFRLGFAELRGCGVPALRRAPVAFPLCVGLQTGAMYGRGEGSGLMVQQAARSLWLATRIGGALRWRPRDGRVGLWLGLDAIVAIVRPEFVTAGGVTVHRAARVGGQALLGVEVRLR